MAQKRCRYCGDEFTPRPHVENIQVCCGKGRCKSRRKAEAQSRWLKTTPHYFKGEYWRTRLWLADHPGYLRSYRKNNPDYVRKDNEACRQRRIQARRRADIQDAWPRREIKRIQVLQGADIQDTYRLRLDGLLCVLEGTPAPIYKTLSTSGGGSG
jgi:hypothetical protein